MIYIFFGWLAGMALAFALALVVRVDPPFGFLFGFLTGFGLSMTGLLLGWIVSNTRRSAS